MQILVSKDIGFCHGVIRAIKLAQDELLNNDILFCVGPLIHNELVLSELINRGLTVVESAEDVASNAKVIIRAHGLENKILNTLSNKNCHIIDATCPSVAKIRENVKIFFQLGYKIIVFGNVNHPEVKGIASEVEECYVTSDIFDTSFFDNGDKFYIVFQTTFPLDNHSEHIKALQEEANKRGKIVDIFNSICYTTLARRESCVKISQLSDAVVVIGDKSSNNTRELYNTAKKVCKIVYYISTPNDYFLIANKLKKIKKLGIIAGASTPKELILEVIRLMESNFKTNENDGVKEVEVTEIEQLTTNPTNDSISLPKKDEKIDEFKAIFDKMPDNRPNKMLKNGHDKEVTVIGKSSDNEQLYVSIEGAGLKNDSGYIKKAELDIEGILTPADFKDGQKFRAVIIATDQKNTVELSKKAFDKILKEEVLVEQLKAGKDVEIVCTGVATKQTSFGLLDVGLNCKVGRYDIFIPKSQMSVSLNKKLAVYENKKILVRLLPPREEGDQKKKTNSFTLYAGQRAIFDEQEDAFWNNITVNNVVKGTVVRYGEKEGRAFGAFVSVNGHDCLAHISELSHKRINHPNEVIEIGKEYNFVILEADREKNKVSLGLKQLEKSPIDLLKEKYPEGSIITGKVERIMDFGVFVSIENGVDGLIHISQISHERVENINSILTVGQEITAKIIKYDDQKISLSRKAVLEPPVEAEEKTYGPPKIENKDKADKFEKVRKTEKKADKTSSEEVVKPKRVTKKAETRESNSNEYISTNKKGVTFGDTEEFKKLLTITTEEEKENDKK